MEGIISFISTTTVRPASPEESTKRIELTPWDLRLLLLGPITRGLLFLKPTPGPEENGLETMTAIVDHLKTSLSRTLDFFYPLAGRLGTTVNDDDDTTCFFIDCNSAGAQFIHAAAGGVTLADILDPVYVPEIVSSFFPLDGVQNYHGVTQPLLAVQLTELVDRIFVGCTLNHVVGDGKSFWHFFNSWSEISRGPNKISVSPVFKRWFGDDTHYPIRIPQSAMVFERPTTSSPVQEMFFHFSKGKIAGLKARANAEMGTDRISSLQALMAHFWRSTIRARHLPEDQETTCSLAIDMRPRRHPQMPQQYFGVAVQGGAVTMKVGELLGMGLAKDPKLATESTIMMRSALIMAGSPRFNVYGNDFGWGRPVAVRGGGGIKLNGKATSFQGAEEGSIDIEACLSPETLKALMEGAEFMG
ncbi:hypothetical protein PVL29_026927 [Vitis rotundifolia]|uniref:Acetyltransferase n=1 Tax=Vitis rotundifolia TaxID=103349 RepID=A0AA38YHS9_VITRO|nr:hypothetical protein PVL29_026927 [Vitis rotundifolia]